MEYTYEEVKPLEDDTPQSDEESDPSPILPEDDAAQTEEEVDFKPKHT